MIRASVAISEHRSLPGHVLTVHMAEQGCPAALGAASASAALPKSSDRAFPGLKARQEVSISVSAPGCV